MFKSGPMDIGTVGTWGTCGSGQLGCSESNSFHVPSLFGAMPTERRMPQAFPNIPALVNLCAETCLPRKWEVFPFARFYSSLSDQSLHRASMDVGLRFLPLRLEDGRTHFGNINSLSQASSELSLRTDLREADRTHSKAGLALEGKKRNVGRCYLLTSLKDGRL